MAIRYAVASGNYSNPVIWDNGAVPLSGDDVYANGFTIVVDQNITANILTNSTTSLTLPGLATPLMTSDITPSGIAFSNGFNGLNFPYLAFNQDYNVATYWNSSTANGGILGYQFPTSKIIKRYAIFSTNNNDNVLIKTWTFEGSNDGVNYTILETVTNYAMSPTYRYISGVLPNSTSYLYYRINITAVAVGGQTARILEFQMTESPGTVYNTNGGGTFQHTSAGFIISANALGIGASNLILYTHLSGTNTLNVANNVVCNLLGGITITSGNVNISIPQISMTSGTIAGGLIKNGAGTLNFTGNVTLNNISTCHLFQLNAGIVNITGNVFGSISGANTSIGIQLQGATLTVTGNVTGGGGTGLTHAITVSSGNLSVIGNVTGGNGTQGLGVSSGTGGNIIITGTITAGNSVVGLFSNNINATVQVSGPLVNVNGISALYAQKYFITSPSTTITTQSSVGVNNIFYNNTSILDALLASNVRDGISFGLGGSLTGTLKVPLPSQVLVGVETDGTVGTWALVPEDFWNYLTSNTFASGSMGDRMKNVSTVASTGAQIASYSV